MSRKLKVLFLGLAVAAMVIGGPLVVFAQEPTVPETIAVPVADEAAPPEVKEAETEAATEVVAEAKVSDFEAAKESLDSPTAPGPGWIPMFLAGLSVLVTILTKFSWVIPQGYRTYAALAVAVLTEIVSTLGELSAQGEVITSGAVIIALVSAVLNKRKTGKP